MAFVSEAGVEGVLLETLGSLGYAATSAPPAWPQNRDFLLAKLMSGEIRIKDVEKTVKSIL